MMKPKKLTMERHYVAASELRRLQCYGMKKAKELGLKEEDVQRLIDEYRSEENHD